MEKIKLPKFAMHEMVYLSHLRQYFHNNMEKPGVSYRYTHQMGKKNGIMEFFLLRFPETAVKFNLKNEMGNFLNRSGKFKQFKFNFSFFIFAWHFFQLSLLHFACVAVIFQQMNFFSLHKWT